MYIHAWLLCKNAQLCVIASCQCNSLLSTNLPYRPRLSPHPLSLILPNDTSRRSSLDPMSRDRCRPLVLLLNGLCFVAGLLVRLFATAATARAEQGGKAVEAAEVTAATAAALTFLAAGLATCAIAMWCPEVSHPVGGSQVSASW